MMNKPINKQIKLSYHTGITQDIDKENSVYITKGWKVGVIDWNENIILEAVRTHGIMPSILKTGENERLKENIGSAQSVMLDFDSPETTFDNMLEIVKTWEHSVFMYNSINHQKPKKGPSGNIITCDRFRILIPLDREINVEQYTRLIDYLKDRFPSVDPSFGMISRYFYITDGRLYHFHNTDKFLNPFDIISENPPLKKLGRPKDKKNTKTFTREDEVMLDDKSIVKIGDITEKTKIYCPFCEPKDRTHDADNASIEINKNGQYQIYCSSEEKKYLQDISDYALQFEDLFFNDNTGYISYNNRQQCQLHTFKNHTDWKNFCNHNNILLEVKDCLPRLREVYNPTIPEGRDLNNYTFNIHRKTETLKKALENKIPEDQATPEYLKTNCKWTYTILENILGYNEDTIEHFLNWLAYLISGYKPWTSWLITTTTQGTGKGLFIEQSLTHIIHESVLIEGSRISGKFNSLLAGKQLVAFDELFMKYDRGESQDRLQILKNLIGSQTLALERKGLDVVPIENFCAFILYSNQIISFQLEDEDRRFNVIQSDGKRLNKMPGYPGDGKPIEGILKQEAAAFATYLVSRIVYYNKVSVILENKERERLMKATREGTVSFVNIFKNELWDELLLEEVFDGYFDSPAEIISKIKEKEVKGLPAKYMKKVLFFHFGTNKKYIRQDLEALGLKNLRTKDKDGKSISVYRHEIHIK